MGGQTTAHVKEKDRSLTLSHHESDAPLLPMAQIERLHEILPEKVDWVFEQAKAEGDYRRRETGRVNLFRFVERMVGVVSGLIIGFAGLAVAGYLAMNNHDGVAGVIGGTTVVGLVSVFVIGQAKNTGRSAQPPSRK